MALTKEIINYVDSTIKRFITTSMNRVVQEAHTHPNKPLLDTLTSAGTGTLYLADDGTYKPVAGGTGTVTSIDVDAGTGISVSPSGPITTSGTFTVTNTAPDQIVSLGTTGSGLAVTGTYPSFTLQNTLPDQTVALTAGTGIGITGSYPNFTITNSSPSSGGTVTSVSALTLGTTGTDLSSTVANGTTTPVITLNVPTASATNRGALSSTDWSTFNNKQDTLVSGTNIKTINSNSILGSGDLTISASAAGSTGQIQFNNGGAFAADSNLFWDNTNKRLGVGATPDTSTRLDIRSQGALSTDVAFRIRNSVNDRNLFSILGNGDIIVRTNRVSLARQNRINIGANNTDNAVDSSNYDEIVMLGYNNTNANFRATILGSSNICPQGGNPSVLVGYGNNSTNGGNIMIGRSNSGQGFLIIGAGNSANGGGNSSGIVCIGNSNSISAANGFPTLPMFLLGSNVTIPNNSSVNNCVFLSAGSNSTAPFVTIKNDNLLISSLTPWTSNFDNNSRGVFYTKNGTPPTTLAVDSIGFYSADIVAGNAAPHFRTENGSVIKLYQETTAIGGATFVANTGTAVNSASTFDGYTIGQIVKALRTQGLLA